MPPDCRGRILEFLPGDGSDPNVRGGGVSAFELERQVKRRREELAEKWAKKISEAFLKISLAGPGEGITPLGLHERFVEEPGPDGEGPDGEVIPLGKFIEWWTFPELKTKVEALGYKWTDIDLPPDREQRIAEGNLTEFERRCGFHVAAISIRRTGGADEE